MKTAEMLFLRTVAGQKITAHKRNEDITEEFFFCGSTVLIRTQAASHRRFLELF
jgi:hypothetical protein